ncbi:MAG TPA: DUF2793 domain-containing protein [Pseudolabrys sp.]|nr:DUF2793 domain-containing protein [Pseudolabrys sp.]
MTDTANLGLPCIEGSQAQKHVTHNDALRILDALVQLAVLDRDLTAPPGSPTEGQSWIVKTGATDYWAGHVNEIASWQDGAWQFNAPRTGWLAYVIDEGTLLMWNGTAWDDFFATVTSIQSLALLGVGTAADTSNPLSVKLNDALFAAKTTSEGGDGDLRFNLNKEAAGNTLSFLFQNGYSGRAEIGTIADDNFSMKVSADGSSWHLGLSLDKNTGHVGLNGYTADATNALGLKATDFLFDNEGGSLRGLLNKHASADDASLGFETNFSTRTLLGLLGDDNFTIKTSPDGSSFHTAMTIDKSSGKVDHPQGAKFSGYVNFDDYHAAGSFAKIGFNVANHNDQGAFSAGSNNFTAAVDGYYEFAAHYVFKKNASLPTQIMLSLFVNKAEAEQTRALTSTVVDQGSYLHTSAVLKLAAGDVVDARCQFVGNDGYVSANYNSFSGARVA